MIVAIFSFCSDHLLRSIALNVSEKTSLTPKEVVAPTTTSEEETNRQNTTVVSITLPQKKKQKTPLVTHPPYNGTLQRIFPTYPRALPCLEPGVSSYLFGFDRKHGGFDRAGMFYTKLSKCSSSTLAGIAVQIARNEAARRKKTGVPETPEECLVKADHGIYRHVLKRDKKRSMLWTFIREPASRQVSDYFHFHVSRRGNDPSDDALFRNESMKALKLVNYMTGNVFYSPEKTNSTAEEKVEHILNAYDFSGLLIATMNR